MSTIHVPKLCKDFYRGSDMVDSRNADVQDEDINLHNTKIKVKPGSMKWYDGSLPKKDLPQGSKYKVNIKESPESNSRLSGKGQIKATSDTENVINITIEDGIVKGLEKMLKLPLPPNREVQDNFGTHLKIDPGKPWDQIRKKVRLSKTVEMSIGATGASATVHTKRKEYKGRFECQVILKGLTTLRTNIMVPQVNISDIIRSLQRRHDDLTDLKVTGPDEVEFTMRGEMEFCWGFDQKIKLNRT